MIDDRHQTIEEVRGAKPFFSLVQINNLESKERDPFQSISLKKITGLFVSHLSTIIIFLLVSHTPLKIWLHFDITKKWWK